MNLIEIKKEISNGKTVCYLSELFEVHLASDGFYYVVKTDNNGIDFLTDRCGLLLFDENLFFIKGENKKITKSHFLTVIVWLFKILVVPLRYQIKK